MVYTSVCQKLLDQHYGENSLTKYGVYICLSEAFGSALWREQSDKIWCIHLFVRSFWISIMARTVSAKLCGQMWA